MKPPIFLASFFFLIQSLSAQVSVSINHLSDKKISIRMTNEGDDIVFVPGLVETGPPTILPNIEISEDNKNWKPVVIASCGVGIRWFPLLPKSRKVATFEELPELKATSRHLRVLLHYTFYDPRGEEFSKMLLQKTTAIAPQRDP